MQVNPPVVVKPSVVLAFREPVPWLFASLSLLTQPGKHAGTSADGAGRSPETTRSPSLSEC